MIEQIRTINGTSPIRTTTFSRIPDLEWVLNANSFSIDRIGDVKTAFTRILGQNNGRICEPCSETNGLQTNDDSDAIATLAYSYPYTNVVTNGKICNLNLPRILNHSHNTSIGTIALVQMGSVYLPAIRSWLAAILWPNQDINDSKLRALHDGTGSQADILSHDTQGMRRVFYV